MDAPSRNPFPLQREKNDESEPEIDYLPWSRPAFNAPSKSSPLVADSVAVRIEPSLRRTLSEEHPATLICMHNLANAYRSQSQYDEAVELSQKTLESRQRVLGDKHPETLLSRKLLTFIFHEASREFANSTDLKERNPPKALDLARKAVALFPEASSYSWQVLGWSHYRMGHWQETIDAETKSIELQKNDGDPWQWQFLAMAHWQLGEKEAAHKY